MSTKNETIDSLDQDDQKMLIFFGNSDSTPKLWPFERFWPKRPTIVSSYVTKRPLRTHFLSSLRIQLILVKKDYLSWPEMAPIENCRKI